MITVLLSGGHLTPALALIDQAIVDKKDFRFIFLGRKYSQEMSKQISQEQAEVEKRKVQFIETQAPKFHKTYWWRNIIELRKIPRALIIAWKTVSRTKPDIFLSFGGYLAFPIALVCRIRQIKVITHEQTVTKGLANQILSLLSDRIAVSHTSSLNLFPRHKSVLTGNPIRPSVLVKKADAPSWVDSYTTKPVLYITGGNQGSEILNRVVEQTLQTLTAQWYVIHQCGNPSKTFNYNERLVTAQKLLPKNLQRSYVVRNWIAEKELAWIYLHATAAVSRSGANTIQELTLHQLPAVLIPIPFSHNNEQQKNAEIMSNAKSAILLHQKDLTPDTFLSALNSIKQKNVQMSKNAEKLKSKMILNGAENLLSLIEQVVAS
ncbi:MAG: glycosyltransferase [Patescibacteria group bacterium]